MNSVDTVDFPIRSIIYHSSIFLKKHKNHKLKRFRKWISPEVAFHPPSRSTTRSYAGKRVANVCPLRFSLLFLRSFLFIERWPRNRQKSARSPTTALWELWTLAICSALIERTNTLFTTPFIIVLYWKHTRLIPQHTTGTLVSHQWLTLCLGSGHVITVTLLE